MICPTVYFHNINFYNFWFCTTNLKRQELNHFRTYNKITSNLILYKNYIKLKDSLIEKLYQTTNQCGEIYVNIFISLL